MVSALGTGMLECLPDTRSVVLRPGAGQGCCSSQRWPAGGAHHSALCTWAHLDPPQSPGELVKNAVVGLVPDLLTQSVWA